MSSREEILNAVKKSQPELLPLPDEFSSEVEANMLGKFQNILESIGGVIHFLQKNETIAEKVKLIFPYAQQLLQVAEEGGTDMIMVDKLTPGQSLEHIQVAVMKAAFGVAENGAVWITEADSRYRVLPFIAEHLVVVIDDKSLVSTMHDAYTLIQDTEYNFGVFIAGPSKTADIEQSLVLGAHGPKTMTVLIRYSEP